MAIWNEKVRVARPDIRGRMIAVSDIHANYEYFTSLLKKVGFCDDDTLIIVGDFLERGPDNLKTLRFITELCSRGNTYAVCGNCDCWSEVVDAKGFPGAEKLLKYMQYRRSGLFYEMFCECGFAIDESTDLPHALDVIKQRYKAEFDFIRAMPGAVETADYVFVHGGMRPDKPIEQQRCGDCMKLDDFRGQGWSFKKWVIVGHWPVTLYIEDHVCASPIIDRDRKIISIDGGCVLKDDGQLNALIIPYPGSEDFENIYYDSFPARRVKTAQRASQRSYYIRWGDSEVEVLRQGEEFSRCRHVRTGYEMDILTKYLYTEFDGATHTNDCSDYALEVSAGDEVGVIEETSRGYYVKHNGTSGWYYGRLE